VASGNTGPVVTASSSVDVNAGATAGGYVVEVTVSADGFNDATCRAEAVVLGLPGGLSVSCDVSLTAALGFDLDNDPNDNHVTLAIDQQNNPIGVTIRLHNPGPADLQVAISGLPELVQCADGVTPVPPLTPVFVPAEADVTVDMGCILASCPGGASFTLAVVGTAVASSDVPCVHDANGNPIQTPASDCSAAVTCLTPASARVGGGGVLMPGDIAENECAPDLVTRVLGPRCNGEEAVKITHGGQLGAPYSEASCGAVAAFPQGDPCIRGQWQHVRHYRGKANPRSFVSIDNTHSDRPIGLFDSLRAACLPCCENPAAGGSLGTLCNGDDHRLCGPQPRSAPANAVVFSGVGQLRSCASSSQKGAGSSQPVVFRVYIEDRSEPGASDGLADVYCFQAWAINGSYTDQDVINARQVLANDSCRFIENYTQGSLPSRHALDAYSHKLTLIIEDGGALRTGNEQIFPSTSATCPD
jgi:hypothetical protein